MQYRHRHQYRRRQQLTWLKSTPGPFDPLERRWIGRCIITRIVIITTTTMTALTSAMIKIVHAARFCQRSHPMPIPRTLQGFIKPVRCRDTTFEEKGLCFPTKVVVVVVVLAVAIAKMRMMMMIVVAICRTCRECFIVYTESPIGFSLL